MNLYYESSNELYHHGIKGMKWGRRRFQTADGSLTAAGRKRYSGGGISGAIRNKQYSNAERDLASVKKQQRQVDSELRELKGYAKNPTGLANSKISTAIRNKQIRDLEKSKAQLKSREKDNLDAMRELDEIDKYQSQKRAERNTPEAKAARRKKALKVGAAVAGTALAVYGAKKVHDMVKEKNIELGHEKANKLFDEYSKSNMYSINMLSDGRVSATSLDGRNSMVFGGDRGNAVNTIGNLNAKARQTASDIQNKALDEAYGANFRTAAKNVGSHYYNNTVGGQAVKSGVNAVRNAPETARNAAKNISESAKDAKKGVEEAARLQRMKNDPNYREALLKKAARHGVHDLSLTGNNHDLAKQMTERGLDPFVIYRKKRK